MLFRVGDAIAGRNVHAAIFDSLRLCKDFRAKPSRSRPGIRTHVENEIDRARADVDTRTERRGSPHSLIAVKNQASYERRVAQRKQDLADFAALRR